ncbi:MAG: M56 family metallopeptidase [Solirubrobacterales bacterium]
MAGILNSVANAWLDWQWPMLWQTAVLIGIVAMIDRLIRKRAWPQLRYMLWLLVFVKLVLPPGLTSPWSVTSQVPALAQQAVEVGMQNPQPPAAVPAIEPLPAEPVGATVTETPSKAEPLTAVPPRTESAPSQAPQAKSEPLSWTVYAMGVWLAGVVVLALGLHIRLRRLPKEHATSRPADVPAWFDELLTQTAKEMGLRRVPPVIFTERVCCPAVFGVLRPILLFPADRLPITRQETRHILLHELAHIKRGDLLVHAGYMVLATIYWFNPLLWLIRKHVQNLRELCCDATVAAHLREETAGYRETLLATGRALLAQSVDPGLGLLGLFENSGWLPVRLQWLQKQTWRYPWLRRASVAVVAILMLCCILPMASIDAAAQRPSDQEFKVTLPCGATIELVGMRRTGANQWWRPDGSPLAESPYDCNEWTDHPDKYEIALRYENLPKDSSGEIDMEYGNWGGSIPMWYAKIRKAGRPVDNISYIIASPSQGTETTSVRVYLAMGSWTTDTTYWRPSNGWDTQIDPSPLFGTLVFSVPYNQDGTTFATAVYPASAAHGQKDVRLTAWDITNTEHPPKFMNGSWSCTGFASSRAEFDLPVNDIVGFSVQMRPYTQIEFKNVALRSGELRKVEIVTTEPSQPVAKEAEKPIEAPEGFSSQRDFSSQVLQAFHTSCTNYLKEHPGSELPKKLWMLKFRFPKPILMDGHYEDIGISYLQYVTSAGYFRDGGFPSLQPEDFELPEAIRTPILYCKNLLKHDNGRGTYVLFGDGHIEYVTAAELERLKATAH